MEKKSKYKSPREKITKVYAMLNKVSDRANKLQAEKDEVYRERNKIVAALSKLFPACLGRHDENDLDWGKEWMNIVYIQIPTGQVSWHIRDTDLELFAHLEYDPKVLWDGHSTEEKYARLLAINS